MLTNADYMNQTAYIPSGTEVISGTVTRWSTVSIWVTFPGVPGEVRFTRSQDGEFRRSGWAMNPTVPPLSWTPAAAAAYLTR